MSAATPDQHPVVLPTAPVLAAVLGGAVSVVLGVLVLAWPEVTLKVGAVLFGIQLVVVGAVRAALGLFVGNVEGWVRAVYVVSGVLVAVAGIVCIRQPVLSVAVIVLVIGVGWLVEGVALIAAGASSESGRWPALVAGGISLVAAVVLLAYPVETTELMLSLGGWLLVLIGMMTMIGVPWLMRESRRTHGVDA
jgi:uncharacterized membrane protein HdeD (DUF308 family)